jgi:hypothetical protein
MNKSNSNRRKFLRDTSMLSGAYLLSGFQGKVFAETKTYDIPKPIVAGRIKFAVIISTIRISME